jgi:hypothetical protein
MGKPVSHRRAWKSGTGDCQVLGMDSNQTQIAQALEGIEGEDLGVLLQAFALPWGCACSAHRGRRSMNTQHGAEQNPSKTPEALSAKDVAVKMKTVSKDLGWKTDPPSDELSHVYLKAQLDGYPSSYVSLSYGRYPYEGRITVSARTSHDAALYRYGEKHLSITVDARRHPDQIRKEIERRFVPPFLKIAAKAEELQMKHNEYRQRLESCLGRLKGELLEESEKQNAKIHLHLDDIWGTVQYGGDDQVGIDFHSVPMEKASRILAILRERTDASKEESLTSDSERRSNHE